MGLTETQWRALQVRAVDPYSSYFSDNVNKHTRIVSGGNDCIVNGLRGNIDSDQRNLCSISPGVCIKDDVMLQFISTVTIDTTDTDFYIDNVLPSSSGVYYIIVVYHYQKTKPSPYAKILLCKPDQFDKRHHLFLHAITIDYYSSINAYGFVDIYDYDPNNDEIHRIYPIVVNQLRGAPNGIASLDSSVRVPPDQLGINDNDIGSRILWSSQKISNELTDLENQLVTNMYSETRMLETLTVDQDYSAPKEITLPNDATYTVNNKSLEVFLNRVRLIPALDYEEIDSRTVKFLVDLKKDDVIIFTEKYGYIDTSSENKSRLDYEHNNIGQHIFTDLTTGVRYRLAVDNGSLILIQQE